MKQHKLKLKINNKIYTDNEMEELKLRSENPSNKEALKDKIHEIHNYMRNNGVGYGMNAMKIFNLIYGLKKIEEAGLLDKVSLCHPECEFSYLLHFAEEDKGERLAELVFGKVLDSIAASNIKELLFYELPKKIKAVALSHLFKEINKITDIEKSCNVLLSGKIYEYFIGRNETMISELGAYFTDRHIVDYIYDKLRVSLNDDGTIGTMCDMFGGSGGFTTGYINYLCSNYPDMINWATEINKIYHFDMNEDVLKAAGLEFFCLTGCIPDMRNNITYANSFTLEFDNAKFKYVVTNPPYGGDKGKISEAQIKRDKIRKYIKAENIGLMNPEIIALNKKQLCSLDAADKQEKKINDSTKVTVETSSIRIKKFAHKHGLSGTDKESISLMLIMDLLEVGGTAIGVLKEGVFFNKVYRKLRQCLIENYAVREIISIPSDQFENTTTKTSIIIFDNNNSTKTINFYDMIINRYVADKFIRFKDEIYIIESKGDIQKISDILVSTADITDLIASDFSLNSKEYFKKELIINDSYDLIKLGDICKFMLKSKRKASEGNKTGDFNFYTSSMSIKKCDIADYTEELIIMGTGGNSSIHCDTMFSCSADNLLIKSNNDVIPNKFIYYSILILWDKLIANMNGSVIKHVTKEILKNFTIFMPKDIDLLNKWTSKISKPYDRLNIKQLSIIKVEDQIMEEINLISIIDDNDYTKLSDICDINYGTRITKKNNIVGVYPVYGGGDITFYTNQYNREDYTIIISRFGVSPNCVRLISDKIFLNDSSLSLLVKPSFNKYYIGYWLLFNKPIVYNCVRGSEQKNIDIDAFKNILIPLPKNNDIYDKLNILCAKKEKLQCSIKKADLLYNKYLYDYKQEIMIA